MHNFYTYLISSLPMLHFGAKPPFPYEKFLEMCEGLISNEDAELLSCVILSPSFGETSQNDTLARWQAFDTALRNELVKIRALRRHIDPAKYLRKDSCTEAYISHLAMNAYRNPSILEAERALDWARWHFLDELSFGHYFDLDILIIYALKLLILEKWDKINMADKEQDIEIALQA